jgi:peptidoglycan/xylan/chitin deacetylase (PgdA/CDA1 family)
MRRRSAVATAGAGALAAWCAPAAAPILPPLAELFGIPLRLPRGRGVAVTFDDGPHPAGTPAVLAELDRQGLRATFYLVGEQVAKLPALAAEIAAAGHEIGIHGFRHTLLLRRSPASLRDDLDRAGAVIGEATGVSSFSYRPPYGVFSLAGLRLANARWSPLLWSHWGRDWEKRATPTSIAALATRELGPGAVILLHDSDAYSVEESWRQTVAALPAVLDAALATGEPLVTPSQST